tara:strand:- start:940 stop:1476 length:537 start_codon:yes stop_codon:yes gene_type:complete
MNTLNTNMDNVTTLAPNRYEVIKLKTGLDIVGMVRDSGEGIHITLPMICQLQLTQTNDTLSTFIPYAPLSAEPTLFIPNTHIVHRNKLNEQFVSYYDNASAKWLEMVENGTIPVKSNQEYQRDIKAYVDKAMQDIINATGGPITPEELRKLEILEDEDFDLETEYEQHLVTKGKKILH